MPKPSPRSITSMPFCTRIPRSLRWLSRQSSRGLLDVDLFGEQERSAAVGEFHQEHAPTEVVDLAHDYRFLFEACHTVVVAHRLEQQAPPTHHVVTCDIFHGSAFPLFNPFGWTSTPLNSCSKVWTGL